MIDDAKKNLENISDINYQCFDCLNIPYPDESFDIVIANHVFFYLKDLNQALKEIQRILKPGGYLYCSTYGSQHMKEITDLVKEYNPKIVLSNRQLYDVFGLDNGKDTVSYTHLKYVFRNIISGIVMFLIVYQILFYGENWQFLILSVSIGFVIYTFLSFFNFKNIK